MADQQPIIIKKVYKSGGGHGGGAWKIAYADFVTAMMAFFLLMWLLNSVTQEQLEGIGNYFAPSTASTSTSGSGDVLAGKTIGEEGVSEQDASRPSVVVDLPPPKIGAADIKDIEDGEASAQQLEELQKQQEEAQFDKAEDALNEAIQAAPQLKQLAESLMIDNTPEGLRIQLVDQEGLAMFPSGGSDMYLHAQKVLELVAQVILEMPQNIAISGHTDAVPFVRNDGFSNWELSADRANNARRVLKGLGVDENRVARVVGRADTEPLMPDDPKNARNRRLSIVLLRGTGIQPVPQQTQESTQEQPAASTPIVAPIAAPDNAAAEDEQPESSPLFDDEETQQ
ncbi:MAG: flagellar motor protein MotB [Rhodospirillaceae bacterium]|jgi:chemotaxis protein MotB|nr:flagellar motor protein MotB [Rhodospirillaceae bacterium]MBT5245372.1 flagellar motor protein MotB [Rhodospirillaceae bacterium]MBT5562528.1 flagellar motor protein MotB [Rhodospirillaceae bacterium]MBT6242899.1 flagellar motor protein MotB [Rhodospirillaceae bacterium]